jgi:hypothetical protein
MLRTVARGGALALGAALLTGCGGSTLPTVGDVPSPRAIEGVRWEPVASGAHPAGGAFLTFDGPLAWHGSDGCTAVQGTYQYFRESGRVTARAPDTNLRDQGTGTRCAGVPTASALQSAGFLRISGGRLLLVSDNDQVILRMARR